MWKIFQKEALGILRYTSRIDFLKIPDHVVLSEFTEMKVTLKTNSADFSAGNLLQGPYFDPTKDELNMCAPIGQDKVSMIAKYIEMGQQLVTALPRSPFASPCLLRACPEVVSRGGKSLRVKKAIRLEEGRTKRRGEQQKSRREVCEVCDDTVCPTRQPFRGGF